MKLVEILARDLKVWPKNNNGNDGITQDRGGRLNSLDTGCEPSFNEEDKCWDSCSHSYLDGRLEEAEDYATSVVTRKMWQAERDRQKGGEWKRHRGGKRPVDSDVKVECRMRNGDVEMFGAGGFMWDHNGAEDDIMSYRVISQPQAEEVEVKDTTIGTLSYRVEVDTSAADQAIDELAAKWDQIETPFKWRDEVTELNAYIEKYTRERDALIERLASEGFALLPAMTAVMGVADVPMAIPCEEWTDGDIVRCVDIDLSCAALTVGKEYTVVTRHGETGVIDDEDDHMCSCIGVGELEFVRRP